MSTHFAIKKSWLLDIQSVNLADVFGATIGVVALLFGCKKSEKEEFADLASSLVVAGAFGANPILLIVSLVSLAKSYTKDKNKNKFKKATLRGVLGMGSFIMTASLFSSPIIGIIIGLIIAKFSEKSKANKILDATKKETNSLLKEAKIEAEALKKDKILQAKEKFSELKSEHEKVILSREKKISDIEERTRDKE